MRRQNIPTLLALVASLIVTFIGVVIIWDTHPRAISQPQEKTSESVTQSATTQENVSASDLAAATDQQRKVAAKLTRSVFFDTRFRQLSDKLRKTGTIRVIVKARAVYRPESKITNVTERLAQRTAIKEAQDQLLEEVKHNSASVKRFESAPYITMSVDSSGLTQLKTSSEVLDVYEDKLMRPAVAESVLKVGAPYAWTAGYNGAGQTIAILDTGVDKNHPLLSENGVSKVVSEACYSTADSDSGIPSLCPNGTEKDETPNSGLHCEIEGLDCEHGTMVAGVAAGESGVATGSNIISIKIASIILDENDCVNGCLRAYTSDVMLGLQRVKHLTSKYNIAAVNLSLSTDNPEDLYPSYCDDQPLKQLIDELSLYGIPVIVPSGNRHSTNSIGYPSCISSTISVGASTDGSESGSLVSDTIWYKSNIAGILDLLSPGAEMRAPIPGTETKPGNGTSLASAHVAGAWAILKQAFPFDSTSTESVWFDEALPARAVPILDNAQTQLTAGFKNAEGFYITAVNGGGWEINLNTSGTRGSNESFRLVDINEGNLESGDSIRLISQNGTHYLSAHGGGAGWCDQPNGQIFANTIQPGTWETFVIRKADGSAGTIGTSTPVTLVSSGNYYFWTEQWSGNGVPTSSPNGHLYANRTTIGDWQKFTLEVVEVNGSNAPSKVAFRSSGGFYFNAVSGSGWEVNVDRTVRDSNQTFDVVDVNGGQLESGDQVRFHKTGNCGGGYYLSIYGGGSAQGTPTPNGRAYMKEGTPSTNETFTITKSDGSSGVIDQGTQISLKTENGYYFCAEGGGQATGSASPYGRLYANKYVGYSTVDARVTFTLDLTMTSGGGSDESWNWVSSNPTPYSGTKAHQSSIATGMKQHSFADATQTLSLNTDESLYTWVYLDPANMPSEVMLQWQSDNWAHRAYWGSNSINVGVDGSESRRYMGELPLGGGWVRLEVPSSSVGLAGKTVRGMMFTQYGGRVTWDKTGKMKGRESLIPVLLSKLKNSGVDITDITTVTRPGDRVGATIPRIRIDAALNHELDIPIDHWKGEYFSNKTWSGKPSMVRDDGTGFIEKDFGVNAPCTTCGIISDNFSIRWTRQVNFAETGLYQFSVTADDGARFFIDNQLIKEQNGSFDVEINLATGNHDLKLEYFESTGTARAGITWRKGCSPIESVATNRWKGEYFNNVDLTGNPVMIKDDGGVFLEKNWGSGNPSSFCSLGSDNFSARWTRTIENMPGGLYYFELDVDDGVRLYIDDMVTPVFDKWSETTGIKTVPVNLTAGTHTIKLEFRENGGEARAILKWRKPCIPDVAPDRWKGEYFKNINLEGEPALVLDEGIDNFIDKNFSGKSPGTDFCNQYDPIASTNYSIRWTRKIDNFQAGDYRFSVTGTYGFRLKVDGVLLTNPNDWVVAGPNTRSLNYVYPNLPAGPHTITFEYYQGNDSTAHARLIWDRVNPSLSCNSAPSDTTHWKGEYFNNQFLSGTPVMVRDEGETNINHNWGSSSPSTACSVFSDYFSSRWTRRVHLSAGIYRFYTWGDNGIRLYVKNLRTNQEQLAINRWSDTAANDESPLINLSNDDYEIRLELFEIVGGAGASVSWASIPNAPSNLLTTAVSTSQINLSWQVNSNNENGFKIERSSNGSGFSQIATIGAGTTSYADTSLASGITYTYRIRSYNNLGDSGYSNTSSATTLIPCSYSVSPGSISVGYYGGNYNISVTTQAHCSWGVSSSGGFISAYGGGTGDGIVNVHIESSSGNYERYGEITIGPHTVPVYQSIYESGGAQLMKKTSSKMYSTQNNK